MYQGASKRVLDALKAELPGPCRCRKRLHDFRDTYLKAEASIKAMSDCRVNPTGLVNFMTHVMDRQSAIDQARHLAAFHCTCPGQECVEYFNKNFIK